MLDTTPSPETETLTWQTALAVGDVVSYRFPVAEDDGTAKPKVRPCLVLDLVTAAGASYARLAYGTTSPTTANYRSVIPVRSPKALRSAGLHRPTGSRGPAASSFRSTRKALFPAVRPERRCLDGSTARPSSG